MRRASLSLVPAMLLAGLPLVVLAGSVPLTPPRPPVVTPEGAPPRDVSAVLARVSAERLRADVDRLAGFGTRHTLSDTAPEDRGIGAARRWIKSEFERALAGTGATVEFDAHPVKAGERRIDIDSEVVNVVATIPGSDPAARSRHIYITAHYDSINSDVMDRSADAPGANDNASGTAALLEMARVLADRAQGSKLDATVVLMATAGEEQGLIGAKRHAIKAAEAGLRIDAVLNMDIVGDPAGHLAKDSREAREARGTVRVFSYGAPRQAGDIELAQIAMLGQENDSPARQTARAVAEVGAWHGLDVQPTLIWRNDRFLRGGDHSAFIEAGFPAAVRFTALHEDYSRQHQYVREEGGVLFGDTAEHVDAAYLAGVTRLVLATSMHLADAPAAPGDVRIITAKLENGTTLRWAKSAGAAGYEVLVRATTSPTWEHVIDAGDAAEWSGPVSKDNWLFGVRAYSRDGKRSLAVFPRAERE